MSISTDQKQVYAGLYVLKRLDLDPKDGGVNLSVDLPHEWQPLEPVIERLVIDNLVSIDTRKGRYRVTPQGLEYIGTLIDEAESYIEEFDEVEVSDMMTTLQRRRIDPMRVRFLWGWYQGEFDDPVVFQQRRGIDPVNYDWADYLLSDTFYDELARDYVDGLG